MEHQLQKYTCPMHPQIIMDAPGKCPLCGMQLEPVANATSHNAYGKHSNHTGMIADFRKKRLLQIKNERPRKCVNNIIFLINCVS